MNIRAQVLAAVLLLLAAFSASASADGTRFFPPNALDRIGIGSGTFEEEWYTRQLTALKEAPLLNPPSDRVLYRFTWLRTFHHPMAFTLLFRPDGTSRLTVRMASGAGGYAPGTLSLDKTVEVNSELTRNLRKGLDSLGFWEMQTQLPNVDGMDGAQWVLEGNQGGKYHVVVRWSGEGIRIWCAQLILLSGVDVGEVY